MADVKRYKFWCDGKWDLSFDEANGGPSVMESGEYVSAADYDALVATLREAIEWPLSGGFTSEFIDRARSFYERGEAPDG